MKKLIIISILTLFLIVRLYATHNRAGEITYKYLSNLSYQVTITTYTFTESLADRWELELNWGDGTRSVLQRTNGKAGINPYGHYCEHLGEEIAPKIKKNIYVGQHNYSGAGEYKIFLEDPNRNGGVVNIPNSINVPFYIETLLVINPFLGQNSSPQLLNSPIDNACIDVPFIHNPGAYDVDGDSLSYKLIPCKGEEGMNISGYKSPQASSYIKIDAFSGDLLWDSPVLQGEYNVAILIEEWRSGVRIGYVIRDMQITVSVCNNKPPQIITIKDTCIKAGTKLQFLVTANDPDINTVTLTAKGGPFQINNPAKFPNPISGKATVSSLFTWLTNCDEVKKQPWQVFFRAVDNGIPTNLVALHTLNIKIIAPAPEIKSVEPRGSSIIVKWSKSYCKNAKGYKLYRSNECKAPPTDYCDTGVPANSGFTLINTKTDINDTVFVDNNNSNGLINGLNYAYLVVAFFEDSAESYPSDILCCSLVKDIPIITNVSVTKTDKSKGTIYIAFSKPTELDTIKYPGPYRYIILRSDINNKNAFIKIDSTDNLNDTIYNNTNLNTEELQYFYRIDLYSLEAPVNYIGSSQVASSIYLSIEPADKQLILNWTELVPWQNTDYIIYKLNPLTQLFDSLTTTKKSTYTDTKLVNKANYCYYIKSKGKYSQSGMLNPIYNNSQAACASPYDNVAPCAPLLEFESDCSLLQNTLRWSNPNHNCTDDVVSYEIWFAQTLTGDFSLIAVTGKPGDTTFIHKNLQGIAGCYSVIAIDSVGNKSVFSNAACVDIDNCKLYSLPNIFTPNGDKLNDLFTPFPYDYVNNIEIKIFNRWGQLVFKSENPQINWDGKDIYSGKDCSDGIYFYICTVYEFRLQGLTNRILKGTVTIIR